MVNKIGYSIVEQLTKNRFFITHPLLEILKKYISEHTGKSSVSCPLKPSDSAPLC